MFFFYRLEDILCNPQTMMTMSFDLFRFFVMETTHPINR